MMFKNQFNEGLRLEKLYPGEGEIRVSSNILKAMHDDRESYGKFCQEMVKRQDDMKPFSSEEWVEPSDNADKQQGFRRAHNVISIIYACLSTCEQKRTNMYDDLGEIGVSKWLPNLSGENVLESTDILLRFKFNNKKVQSTLHPLTSCAPNTLSDVFLCSGLHCLGQCV